MKTTRIFRNLSAAGAALLLCAVAISAQAPRATPADASMAARLQRLEDIMEIQTLLLDYGRFLDARDLPAYSRLFAKDEEWVGGFGQKPGGHTGFHGEKSRNRSQPRQHVSHPVELHY